MRLRLLPMLLAGLLLSGCSDLNKALKSKDIGYKLSVAEKYFQAGESGAAPGATRKQRRKARSAYEKGLPILEELNALTRFDTTFEKVSYMYAKSHYGIRDYILAGYYLENFSRTFPGSRYAEECEFLSAVCNYKEPPEHELDQQSTFTAIDQLQLFTVRHPASPLRDSCNTLVDLLRRKLEEKDFVNSILYVRTGYLEAAGVSLRNFLKKWPNSAHREEVLYNIMLADHDLAAGSVEAKQLVRIEEGLRSCEGYLDAYPADARSKEANGFKQDLLARKERLLYNALVATHEQVLVTRGQERLDLIAQGLRSFDTFAAAFPQSSFLPQAERLRQELLAERSANDRQTPP